MQERQVEPKKTEEVVKEMFWLAWKACGRPQGMGFLQDRPDATREDVYSNAANRGDYAGVGSGKQGEVRGDYVFGRMMKLFVEFDAKAGVIRFRDENPTRDYQSWCREYPTYEALFDAAVESVG